MRHLLLPNQMKTMRRRLKGGKLDKNEHPHNHPSHCRMNLNEQQHEERGTFVLFFFFFHSFLACVVLRLIAGPSLSLPIRPNLAVLFADLVAPVLTPASSFHMLPLLLHMLVLIFLMRRLLLHMLVLILLMLPLFLLMLPLFLLMLLLVFLKLA